MREAVIVSAVRTPIGSFGGALSTISAVELGALVIKEALQRAGVSPGDVDEVMMGNVLQAGLGQNPARQAAMKAGIPEAVPSFTINKVCGSGLKSISLACLSIFAGESDIVVAGGMENMSLSPYVLDKARTGYKMGDGKLVDVMIKDGLMDAFYDIHMGITAENVAERYGLSREELDLFTLESQNRASSAQDNGIFDSEMVYVSIPQKKGEPKIINQDEHIRPGLALENLQKLKPAFKLDGRVTAGNSSGINDGAAAVVVMSKEKAESLGISPLAVIRSFASAGCDPRLMGLGPVPAVHKALSKAGLENHQLDLIELNEAFAAQSIAVIRELKLDHSKVNVNGGAIALGHPIGASGARIVVTLLHEMKRRQVRTGLASLCIGGGQGIAMVLEAL